MAAWLELNVKWWKLQLHHTIYRIEGPDTFDGNDLLRQFDRLQSNKSAKIDILAQAMELSSIPSDSNNNLDIVGQAMEMSDIQSDMMMNFWKISEKLEACYILNEILHILLKLN